MYQTNKYMLFMGDRYYPSGGMNDFFGLYDTTAEAIETFKDSTCEWAQVVKLDSLSTPHYVEEVFKKTTDGYVIKI